MNERGRAGEEDLPQAVSESTMELLGAKIRVYHLSDGRRVIHKDDFDSFVELMLSAEESPN